MKRSNVLFSFSAMALTMSAFASVLLLDKPTKGDIQKDAPIVEAKVASVPVEPLPPVIELPDVVPLQAVKADIPKPRAFKSKIAAALPVKEKQMVCEVVWNDSNYGGKYKRCEMK